MIHFHQFRFKSCFFLLDMNIAKQTAGPHFAFEPYAYGPFDKQVYFELGTLKDGGLVEIIEAQWSGSRTYRLTNEGLRSGQEALRQLPKDVQKYVSEVVTVIRSLSFAELVSAIYKAYPNMRVNSVFVQGTS